MESLTRGARYRILVMPTDMGLARNALVLFERWRNHNPTQPQPLRQPHLSRAIAPAPAPTTATTAASAAADAFKRARNERQLAVDDRVRVVPDLARRAQEVAVSEKNRRRERAVQAPV